MNQVLSFPSLGPQELAAGNLLLNGQYRIVEHLQQGGFANTYLAIDSLNRQVVVKECFPSGMCERARGRVRAISPAVADQFTALKRQFINEARTMATLRHANIVAVHQVFEENDSAYMALDFVAGIDLITLLEDHRERLTPAFLESSLRQSLEAVRYIHEQGILHRDIAPDNIRVDAAGKITLIDFGAARNQAGAGEAMTSPLMAVKDGYSPYEFYQADGPQDRSSDLYSLGATFYHLITGQAPPDSDERHRSIRAGWADPFQPLTDGNWSCGYHLLSSIDRALELDRANRLQSADQWLATLDTTPKLRPAAVTRPRPAMVFDPDLEATVSQLVRETNAGIVAHVPVKQGQYKTAPVAAKAVRPPRKRWFDLSGAPIDNLDLWNFEQERAAQHRAQPPKPVVADLPPAPEPVVAAPPPPPPPAPDPVRGMKSLVAGLGRRNTPRTPDPTAT